MSRSKKSRKPGIGSIGVAKDEKKKDKEIAPHSKKPKNKSGKRPGNRQQEAFDSGENKGTQKTNKDPRIGSKKPIVLGSPITKPPQHFKTKVKEKTSPIAAIRVIEPESSLEDELYAIEDDAQLQVILSKQDDDVALTEVEINYFNEKMTRHQTLRELLGLNDDNDEEEDDDNKTKSNSEDDLWDKLDNSDLSDY
jgi:ribosome assembly protein YihI (activator of Der GTPase)